jgi:hypothetical protein
MGVGTKCSKKPEKNTKKGSISTGWTYKKVGQNGGGYKMLKKTKKKTKKKVVYQPGGYKMKIKNQKSVNYKNIKRI